MESFLCRGFKLPAKYVIHTVGPVYKSEKDSAPLLYNAHRCESPSLLSSFSFIRCWKIIKTFVGTIIEQLLQANVTDCLGAGAVWT